MEGFHHTSLDSVGVAVVGSSSEAYAEAVANKVFEFDRITENERVGLIKDDQATRFGNKVKSGLVTYRLSRGE